MSEPLWSDEQLRLVAFNVATIYLMDKSAGKATPMTQLIEAAMIEMRDDMQAGLTALENDNDRLRQQVTQLTERNQRLQLTPAEKDAFDTFFHYLDKYAYMTPWLDDKDFVDVICAWGDRMDKDDADHE